MRFRPEFVLQETCVIAFFFFPWKRVVITQRPHKTMKLKFLLMTRSFQMAKTDPKAKASFLLVGLLLCRPSVSVRWKKDFKIQHSFKRCTSEEKDYRWHRRPRLWDAFSLRRTQETDVYLPPIFKLDFLKGSLNGHKTMR